MAIFTFWAGWDLDSHLQQQVPACLLPWSFPGHWHWTASAPWCSPRPGMATAGVVPTCVPWTVQLFGRAMLTESKKHLILHLPLWVYCIVHTENIKVVQLNVFYVLITWAEWNFFLAFFLSQTLPLTLKHFLTVAIVLLFTPWNRQRSPRLCLRISAICINAACKKHCMWIVESFSVKLFGYCIHLELTGGFQSKL